MPTETEVEVVRKPRRKKSTKTTKVSNGAGSPQSVLVKLSPEIKDGVRRASNSQMRSMNGQVAYYVVRGLVADGLIEDNS
jgi:hypothetical protein